MTAVRRALPALAALLTLSSCGIPATGVVEAGGPATGIAPVTAVYFVQDGALMAILRPTDAPGDGTTALGLLLKGPPPGKGITTEVKPLLPAEPATAPPATAPSSPALSSFAPAAVVTEDKGTLTVRLPDRMSRLSDLGIDQVVCTVAAARRVSAPELSVVTVELVAGDVRLARQSDRRCPQP